MADMANNGKPWWESQLDWNLPDHLHQSLRLGRNMLRNIPQTLTAYRLGKGTPIDSIEPDPVEKIKGFQPTQKPATPVPPLKTAAPADPPKPITMGIPRAVNVPTALPEPDAREKVQRIIEKIEQKKLTLEQMLDPEYTGYR